MSGPLSGIKVVDLSRLAPGPFASMLLGDLGADIVVVDPPSDAFRSAGATRPLEAQERQRAHNPLGRNKKSIVVNLKDKDGPRIIHDLAKDADVFLEGFRPGVTDRLGVGYEAISQTNPRIVYASLSGYGQSGPYRDLVGHDLNYISVGGALAGIGRPGSKPAIPINTLADFAGGGLMTAFAITSALVGRQQTGKGQYLDMSMSDGVLYLLASQSGGVLAGGPPPAPGQPGLSGGSPHYDVYECADGKYLSIGSLEPQFWEALCRVVGREDMIDAEYDQSRHAEFREHLTAFFRTKTRDEWFAELQGIELCVAPVLNLEEALANEHARARGMVVEVDDPVVGRLNQVGIGPKFSSTPGAVRTTAPHPGEHTEIVLGDLGYSAEQIAEFTGRGAVA